jgi:hypothetical protein
MDRLLSRRDRALLRGWLCHPTPEFDQTANQRQGQADNAPAGFLRGVFHGTIHLALEFNQRPVRFCLRAPLGTISVAGLYAHVLAIVYEPQASLLEQVP